MRFRSGGLRTPPPDARRSEKGDWLRVLAVPVPFFGSALRPGRMAAVLLLLGLALQDGVKNQANEQHVLHGQRSAAVHQPAALAHAQAIDAGRGRIALLDLA